jgi:hypothetical protein
MKYFFLGIKVLIHKTSFTFKHTRPSSTTKCQGLLHMLFVVLVIYFCTISFFKFDTIMLLLPSIEWMHSNLISYLVSSGANSIAHCFPIMRNCNL